MKTDFSDVPWSGPELKSVHGPAWIWKVNLEDTFKETDGTEFVNVHYCLKDDGWYPGGVYSGYWKLPHILKLLEP